MRLPFAVSPSVIALAFGVSGGIGVVFGWHPAKKAADLCPLKLYAMNRKILILLIFIVSLVGWYAWRNQAGTRQDTRTDEMNLQDDASNAPKTPFVLTIETLRKGSYPGSDITVVETLAPGSNYNRYRVSYKSEGLTIYALLTIPRDTKPETGFPVIVFNHGYIPPLEYRTTERYLAYTDAFSRAGYILIKPDYRGHGESEGNPEGAYGSNAYTIDVLNALASIKRHPLVDKNRIGMWGHSMGGFITLRAMVTAPDIKAGVIWGGVIGSYADMLNNWRRRSTITPSTSPTGARRWRDQLIRQYGEPETNPSFWHSISANSFLADISGPLQLHHGSSDTSVPVAFSQTLERQMTEAGKHVELYIYEGDDHNISANLSRALGRSVEFFDRHVKGGIQ